jgi:hypothetical protein
MFRPVSGRLLCLRILHGRYIVILFYNTPSLVLNCRDINVTFQENKSFFDSGHIQGYKYSSL